MQIPQNEIPARLYAGLYLGTGRQKRFWGWSSREWGKLQSAAASRPLQNLGEWLRQAHAQLDGPASCETSEHSEHGAQPSGSQRRFQFVCNRRMIGLLIR